MELIIRDDDVCYYTPPELLEHCYGEFWNKYPIHLAVIPFVYGGDRPAPYDKRDNMNHNLRDNGYLLNYIKSLVSENKVKVWLHGYSHKNEGNKFEMESNDYPELYKRVYKGKAWLERMFGREILFFVAPHDRFSKVAINAVRNAGIFRICRGYSPRPRELILADMSSNYKLVKNHLFNKNKLRISRPLKLNGTMQFFSYRIQEFNLDNYKKIIDHHKEGLLCITCHHKTFTEYQREMLRIIIDEVDGLR